MSSYNELRDASSNLVRLIKEQNDAGLTAAVPDGSEPLDVLLAKAIFNAASGSTTPVVSGMTPAQILAALIAVDGSGSGLDSDTVDGIGASGFQPIDSDLTAIAALSTTAYGRAVLALADAAALRTAAGLGTLATQSGTFSGTSSGTNTGDNVQTTVSGNAGSATVLQTARTIDGVSFNGSANITVIAPGTTAATSKATPVDADEVPLVDSAASNVLKKLTWANLKATAKAYFDTLYLAVAGNGSQLTALNPSALGTGSGAVTIAAGGTNQGAAIFSSGTGDASLQLSASSSYPFNGIKVQGGNGITVIQGGLVTTSNIAIPSNEYIYWSTRALITSSANGAIHVQNYDSNDSVDQALVLGNGGASTSVRLHRTVGTQTLQVRNGNNTAYADVAVRNLTPTGGNGLAVFTVATLPASAATGMFQGSQAFVTDALAPAFLVAIASGGSAKTPVVYDGSAWIAV